jgi:DNA-binding transcriptional ArsR family regulator
MKYAGMDIFTALADPTRRHIVEFLGQGEQAVGAITEQFELSPPAISQHLKVLKQAELVHVRIDGQRRIYSLNPQGLSALDDWLDRMRRFWSGSLDALERELKKPAAKAKPKSVKSRGDQK